MEYDRQLGKGSYSSVTKINYGGKVCAKKLYTNHDGHGIPFDMIREVAILKTISSPYVISIIDMTTSYIILPLYQTTLAKYVVKSLTTQEIKDIFFSLCSGI